MAGFNEILEGRFNRALQRLLSMKGAASMNELGTVLTPSVPFHVDAEQRYLESWDSFGYLVAGNVNAVNGSSMRFRNPSNSGVLAVFSRIQIEKAGGAGVDSIVLEIGATAADLATVASIGRSLDTRTVRLSSLIGSLSAAAGSVGFGTAVQEFTYAAAPVQTETMREMLDGFHRVVLTPGFALQLRSATANQAFNANFLWEERTLGDGER